MPVFSTDAAAAGVRAELQAELDSLTTSDANQDTALAALITNDEAQDTAIAGVQAELVTKADAAALATVSTTGQYSALLEIPSTFAPAAHDQAWSTILGTPTTLAGYGIADAASAAQGALAATAVQPAAISSFETSAQLNTRDTANRARANHTGTQAASSISDFAATAAATAPVQSVGGRAGVVTLAKGDVGLAAVDNTADVAKPVSTAAQTALDAKAPLTPAQGTITYGAIVNLDMATLNGQLRTILLTGNLDITASNQASQRSTTLRLISDSTLRTLSFPVGWKFLGTRPTSIPISKVGVLSLTFFGSTDADCVAAWGVQS